MKNTYQTSVYLDNEVKNKLEFIAEKHQRNKNNMINYLINKEYEDIKKKGKETEKTID